MRNIILLIHNLVVGDRLYTIKDFLTESSKGRGYTILLRQLNSANIQADNFANVRRLYDIKSFDNALSPTDCEETNIYRVSENGILYFLMPSESKPYRGNIYSCIININKLNSFIKIEFINNWHTIVFIAENEKGSTETVARIYLNRSKFHKNVLLYYWYMEERARKVEERRDSKNYHPTGLAALLDWLRPTEKGDKTVLWGCFITFIFCIISSLVTWFVAQHFFNLSLQ